MGMLHAPRLVELATLVLQESERKAALLDSQSLRSSQLGSQTHQEAVQRKRFEEGERRRKEQREQTKAS